MKPIELKLDQGRGAFVIEENEGRLAEMAVAVTGNNLVVYHMEVSEILRGKGIASQLLEKMTEYARTNGLKVVPLCPYVLAQFKRHPEEYKDLWNQNWHEKSN